MPFSGLFPSRLDLLAFGEIPPSRWAICRLGEPCPFETVSSRQQTTLQPNPTDRKPTLEAERQGLGCRNRERSGLFGLVVLGVNTQNFARFWEISSHFAVFFRIFFVVGRSFSQTVKSPAVFWDEACKISRRCSPREETLQSMGAGVSVMPWRSAVWGRCRRAKLIMLEHYITGARGRVMHATNYSLTCILPR